MLLDTSSLTHPSSLHHRRNSASCVFFQTILYWIELCCTIFYSGAALCLALLYCTVLCCTVLYYVVLYCRVRYYIIVLVYSLSVPSSLSLPCWSPPAQKLSSHDHLCLQLGHCPKVDQDVPPLIFQVHSPSCPHLTFAASPLLL